MGRVFLAHDMANVKGKKTALTGRTENTMK